MTNWCNLILLLLFLGTQKTFAQYSNCSNQETDAGLTSSYCATFQVPLDHEMPDGETIDLFVRKFPSTQKSQGSLWLISGGPGESGASLYPLVNQFKELFPDVDIYVPDHRGTGLSGKICPKEESVESAGGISLVGEEWSTCFGYMFQNEADVKNFSITNAAKDLQFLINGTGDQGKRYVYGVSYGTQLILRMLQLGKVELDGLILDSLVPLQDDDEHDLSHRSQVTDDVGKQVLERFQKWESKDGPTLLDQMKNVVHRSKNDSTFIKKLPKQRLTHLFGMLLDLPKTRNRLPEVIKSLYKDDFGPLNVVLKEVQQFYESYGARYVTSSNSIPLAQVISCSENNLRSELTKEEVQLESEELLFTSPLPLLLAGNGMPVYVQDAHFGKVPEKMPKTMVLHGTLDPKTHLKGALQHVEQLAKNNPVTLVKVEDAPHFIALFAPNVFKTSVTQFLQNDNLVNKMEDSNVALKSVLGRIP